MKRVESEAAEEYNDSMWKSLRFHRQVDTVREVNMIYETGLFDISYAVAEGNSQRVFVAFGESTWSWGLVVVDFREGGAAGGGVFGVADKSLNTPPSPEAAAYQHRGHQAHRPHLKTHLHTLRRRKNVFKICKLVIPPQSIKNGPRPRHSGGGPSRCRRFAATAGLRIPPGSPSGWLCGRWLSVRPFEAGVCF